MARIFGFDIGTTSVGWAVVDLIDTVGGAGGTLQGMGVRIFPEARDPKGTPLNQERRQKRMLRRQLRRRRARRKGLNELLAEAGLLPQYGSPQWPIIMQTDPLPLRVRGLKEKLDAHELGRALYHLSKRRHFKGRDFTEEGDPENADEVKARGERETTLAALKASGSTLGEFLAAKSLNERKRGVHALRSTVRSEFDRLVAAQSDHHPILKDAVFRAGLDETIFAQRPVFWRKNTLGECRLVPGAALCPRGSWLSQERRMLEKVNNLALAGGNARPLDEEERAAILSKLRTQASMTWGSIRTALKPLYKSRGETGVERSIRFNMEVVTNSDAGIPGNALEAKLAAIFGDDWTTHLNRDKIRDQVHDRLWECDYGEIGTQRVVIRDEAERKSRRAAAVESFVHDFAIAHDEAAALGALSFPAGWEPFSTEALRRFMPKLEKGIRFGTLLTGAEWEGWRAKHFPRRLVPTGEILDRLPTPTNEAERKRQASLRNPTVVRVQNELRKVVNNLIGVYGRPALIRIELAREVGKSKREREEMSKGIRGKELNRRKAATDLKSKGIVQPSRADVEKWMLWQECGKFDFYSGRPISFDDLFGNAEFDVEHIWPRWKSMDNSAGNKTLCLKKLNHRKSNRTPFEAFEKDADWPAMKERVWKAVKEGRMSAGKARRFCRETPLDDGFVARQLVDTGYAARQATAFLKRLWPDLGPNAPVTVQAVSGRVTAQLRRLWKLNNILSDDGEKTREDHRHHAVDALVVACTHPGLTNRLSTYWQACDASIGRVPEILPPWPTIRDDAEKVVKDIVVSHRVRRKVSGPLNKGTVYGDTKQDVQGRGRVIYRKFVTRWKVEELTKNDLESDDIICDPAVRQLLRDWVEAHGGDPKKAFTSYPHLGGNGGAEVRKVRVHIRRQQELMASVANGFVEVGLNHHIAVYRSSAGKPEFEVVSLQEAARRLSRREPIVRRNRGAGSTFMMSLAPGDTIRFALKAGMPETEWVVQKVASKGQVSLLRLTDASPTEQSLFEPKVGGLLARNLVKLSVDPIGRIRPASD
jgi:CRISPR-associated endonuclease Csn1